VLMVTGGPQYLTYWDFVARSDIYFWWAVIATLGALSIWLVSRALRYRPA